MVQFESWFRGVVEEKGLFDGLAEKTEQTEGNDDVVRGGRRSEGAYIHAKPRANDDRGLQGVLDRLKA